jgi:hypothetical protein
MKAQAASLPFTPVFAAVVAILDTKLPQVGELLLARLISSEGHSSGTTRFNSYSSHSLAQLNCYITDCLSLENDVYRTSRESIGR